MRKLNKKGFTLIELLAVIVILAVVMLIAITAVGPLMQKSRKAALLDEGLALIKAGQLAHESGLLEGTDFTNKDVCFTVEYLKQKGYFPKGKDEGYAGSVRINADGTVKYFLTNGDYYIRWANQSSTLESTFEKSNGKSVKQLVQYAEVGKEGSGLYKYYKACGKKPAINMEFLICYENSGSLIVVLR